MSGMALHNFSLKTFPNWQIEIYKEILATLTFNFLRITYMIGNYNLSVRIIDRVSQTIYVVCVNFIHKWRDLKFEVNSGLQIFEKLFMTVLFTL